LSASHQSGHVIAGSKAIADRTTVERLVDDLGLGLVWESIDDEDDASVLAQRLSDVLWTR
jgi:hypothetical protein